VRELQQERHSRICFSIEMDGFAVGMVGGHEDRGIVPEVRAGHSGAEFAQQNIGERETVAVSFKAGVGPRECAGEAVVRMRSVRHRVVQIHQIEGGVGGHAERRR